MDKIIEEIKKTKKFPPIISKKVHGDYVWSIDIIEHDNSVSIRKIYGYVKGALTERKTPIKAGKNIGKKNETDQYGQAFKEALAEWIKHSKQSGKLLKIKGETSVFPMLAKALDQTQKMIIFPWRWQYKLDGVRGLCYYNSKLGKIILRSKDADKEITAFPHITEEMTKIFDILKKQKEVIYFDFEFFGAYPVKNKTDKIYPIPNQIINSLVSATKHKSMYANQALVNDIKMNIFDLFNISNLSWTFDQRYALLKLIFDTATKKGLKFKYIILLDTYTINSMEELKPLTIEAVKKGYEGLIIRNPNGIYKIPHTKSSGRSSDLLKFKLKEEGDAKILGMIKKKSTKKSEFNFVFQVQDMKDTSLSFEITANGTAEMKKKAFADMEFYRNKILIYNHYGKVISGKPKHAVPILESDGTYKIKFPDKPLLSENVFKEVKLPEKPVVKDQKVVEYLLDEEEEGESDEEK
jgi:DNA ligase 1